MTAETITPLPGAEPARVVRGLVVLGDSTPVGSLPPGPVSTITTSPNQFVAVALPRAPKNSGLVWRLARRYDSGVVRQISEADLDANVVLVFKVVSRGKTSLAATP